MEELKNKYFKYIDDMTQLFKQMEEIYPYFSDEQKDFLESFLSEKIMKMIFNEKEIELINNMEDLDAEFDEKLKAEYPALVSLLNKLSAKER